MLIDKQESRLKFISEYPEAIQTSDFIAYSPVEFWSVTVLKLFLREIDRQNKGYTEEKRIKRREYIKQWRLNYPEKLRAHRIIGNEVLRGRLRSQKCAVCGNKKTGAHHTDYSKPLDIIWLCHSCHQLEHSRGGILLDL